METPAKPTITQLQANWQIHIAGIQAEKAAREQGAAPGEIATLLDAASGGIIVAGLVFPPIHSAFMLMLSKVEALTKTKPALATEMNNLAALALILHSPRQAWAMLRDSTAEAADLFEAAVIEFAMQLTLADLRALMAWVATEMERLKDQGENAGKPSAAQ